MTVMEGKVGEGRQGVADGTTAIVRFGKTGGLVTTDAHGRYWEAAIRGRLFHGCTATSGVAPGTALGTTAAFYLHNPVGSNVVLSLLHSSIGYVSGTMGAGAMYYTTHAGIAVASPTGTAITVRSALVGGNLASVGLAFTTATVITQVPLRPLMNMFAALATTALGPSLATDLIDGDIAIPPGFGVGIHGVAAAGTSPLVTIGLSWEEIPVLP